MFLDDEKKLSDKDIEWSKGNIPESGKDTERPTENNAETDTDPARKRRKLHAQKNQVKVRRYVQFVSPFLRAGNEIRPLKVQVCLSTRLALVKKGLKIQS